MAVLLCGGDGVGKEAAAVAVSLGITAGIKGNHKCVRQSSYWQKLREPPSGSSPQGFGVHGVLGWGGGVRGRDDGIVGVTHTEQPNTSLYLVVNPVTLPSLPRAHFPHKADNSPG